MIISDGIKTMMESERLKTVPVARMVGQGPTEQWRGQ